MKRSNLHWAKFAARAAVGLGMLAGAASPALAQVSTEIVALTVNPTGTILPGRTAATISGTIMCDPPGQRVAFNFLHLNQTGRNTQFINAVYAPGTFPTINCDGTLQTWSYTAQVIFPFSGRLHKGKAGVTVQFDDYADDHIAFGSVFIQ